MFDWFIIVLSFAPVTSAASHLIIFSRRCAQSQSQGGKAAGSNNAGSKGGSPRVPLYHPASAATADWSVALSALSPLDCPPLLEPDFGSPELMLVGVCPRALEATVEWLAAAPQVCVCAWCLNGAVKEGRGGRAKRGRVLHPHAGLTAPHCRLQRPTNLLRLPRQCHSQLPPPSLGPRYDSCPRTSRGPLFGSADVNSDS